MNKTRLHVTYWKMSGFFQLGPKLHEQLEMPSASQSLFLDECAAYLSLNKNATGRIYTKCYLFTCSDLRSCRSRRGVSLSVRAHLGSARVSETEDEEEILTWFTGSRRVK